MMCWLAFVVVAQVDTGPVEQGGEPDKSTSTGLGEALTGDVPLTRDALKKGTGLAEALTDDVLLPRDTLKAKMVAPAALFRLPAKDVETGTVTVWPATRAPPAEPRFTNECVIRSVGGGASIEISETSTAATSWCTPSPTHPLIGRADVCGIPDVTVERICGSSGCANECKVKEADVPKFRQGFVIELRSSRCTAECAVTKQVLLPLEPSEAGSAPTNVVQPVTYMPDTSTIETYLMSERDVRSRTACRDDQQRLYLARPQEFCVDRPLRLMVTPDRAPPSRTRVSFDSVLGDHEEGEWDPLLSNRLTLAFNLKPGLYQVSFWSEAVRHAYDASINYGWEFSPERIHLRQNGAGTVVLRETRGKTDSEGVERENGRERRERRSSPERVDILVSFNALELMTLEDAASALGKRAGGRQGGIDLAGGPRSLLTPAADEAAGEFLSLVAEVALERASAKATDLYERRLVNLVCDRMPKTITGESMLSGTCELLRHVRLADAAGSGQALLSALLVDVATFATHEVLEATLQAKVPEFAALLDKVAEAADHDYLIATLPEEDSRAIRDILVRLYADPDLKTAPAVLESIASHLVGSKVATNKRWVLDQRLVALGNVILSALETSSGKPPAGLFTNAIADAQQLRDELARAPESFTEPTIWPSDEVAKFGKRLDELGQELMRVDAQASVLTPKDEAALLRTLDAVFGTAPQQVEVLRGLRQVQVALNRAGQDPCAKATYRATRPAIRLLGEVAHDALGQRPFRRDLPQQVIVEMANAFSDAEMARCATTWELQLAFALLARCHADGGCDARAISDLDSNAAALFTGVDPRRVRWSEIQDFVALGLEVLNPSAERDVGRQLRDAVSVLFSILDMLAMNGVGGTDREDALVRLRFARELFDAALAHDVQAALTASTKVLEYVAETNSDVRQSAALRRAARLLASTATYLSTYVDDSKASPEERASRRQTRKDALVKAIDASTDRHQRQEELIVSLGVGVGLPVGTEYQFVGDHDVAVPRPIRQPVSLPLGVSLQVPLSLVWDYRASWSDDTRSVLDPGFILSLNALDLGQYVSFQDDGLPQPRLDTALSFGASGGVYLSYDYPVFVVVDLRYAPTLYSNDPLDQLARSGAAARIGILLGAHIPLFDFN